MKRISLRMPDDLHAQVQQAAERDQRSLHAQILWLIQQSLTQGEEHEKDSRH